MHEISHPAGEVQSSEPVRPDSHELQHLRTLHHHFPQSQNLPHRGFQFPTILFNNTNLKQPQLIYNNSKSRKRCEKK